MFYSGSVVKIAGKITFEVYILAQKLSCRNPKGMATESSEGNITTFRALVLHLNEANLVAEGDADSDVTISKFRFSIDFDSIFSPK